MTREQIIKDSDALTREMHRVFSTTLFCGKFTFPDVPALDGIEYVVTCHETATAYNSIDAINFSGAFIVWERIEGTEDEELGVLGAFPTLKLAVSDIQSRANQLRGLDVPSIKEQIEMAYAERYDEDLDW